MLVADLAQALEVSGRRREAASGVLHRLDEDGRDAVGALHLDRLADLVGGPPPELLGSQAVEAGDLVGAVVVGVRHAHRARHERLEGLLEGRDAGDRQGALRGAVVGDRAADDLVLARLAGELEELLGELPGRLDRLAAACGEEHTVQVTGGELGEPLGQLGGLRVRVGPQGEEGELLGLLGGGLGELGAPVARLHDEQAGQAVQVALAVDVVDMGTVAPHDRRDLAGVVGAVPGEVHPQVVLRCPQDGGRVGFRSRHGYLSSVISTVLSVHVPHGGLQLVAWRHYARTSESVISLCNNDEIRLGVSGLSPFPAALGDGGERL